MKLDIARAWKDEAYRQSLSSEELAQLPENPVGELELNDAELNSVQGARHGGGGFFSAALIGCDQHNSQTGFCNSYNGTCQSVGGSCISGIQAQCFSIGGNCSSNNGGTCVSVDGSFCFSIGSSSCNFRG
jgi:mersacidin/lichenicidin family type 2 lantibiotic